MKNSDYQSIGAEEVIRHFFGVGKNEVEPASETEQETFLNLLNQEESVELAADYLNCWLILRNLKPLSDPDFIFLHENGKLTEQYKKKG
tara:strand:+ start:8447 stop:8713 length:267 start_codon:yes stop_codon:yes gene_type:complete